MSEISAFKASKFPKSGMPRGESMLSAMKNVAILKKSGQHCTYRCLHLLTQVATDAGVSEGTFHASIASVFWSKYNKRMFLDSGKYFVKKVLLEDKS